MAYGSLFSTKLIADGRFQEAVETAEREIATAPHDPEPYFNRGRALAGLERWEAAVEDYTGALQRDADASAVDPAEIDDELFFALRQWAVSERDQSKDVPRALAVLDRYQGICPQGRHTADLDTWRDHLRGVETVWIRERV
ncbi:MAG: tetratricopeptide repeat protein [Deltaproteobacteria bacterium]|nr:tetratricopeptide repeat protein [Deltaproteobacteria bacterium]